MKKTKAPRITPVLNNSGGKKDARKFDIYGEICGRSVHALNLHSPRIHCLLGFIDTICNDLLVVFSIKRQFAFFGNN